MRSELNGMIKYLKPKIAWELLAPERKLVSRGSIAPSLPGNLRKRLNSM